MRKFKETHKVPNEGLRKLRLIFVSQIKTRPPTFSCMVNYHDMIDEKYEKFIRSQICKEFEMAGIPIRIVFRGLKYKRLKQKVEKIVQGERVNTRLRLRFIGRRHLRPGFRHKLNKQKQ